MALVAFLAISSCAVMTQSKGTTEVANQQSTTQQASALVKQELVKDTTTEVLVDKEIQKDDIVRVVQHGDHWHVFTRDGKEHITYVNPENASGTTLSFVSVASLEQLKNLDVVSIHVHGDHWHVRTRDGKEYLTYEDPSGLFKTVTIGQYQGNHGSASSSTPVGGASNVSANGLDVIKIAKHGDHYHVYTRDGQEYVVYNNPRALYPNAEYVEYTGSHSGNVGHHDDHDDHDHDDHDHADHNHGTNNTGNGSTGGNATGTTPPTLNIVKVVSGDFLKTVAIDKILKHGDHYHVYTKDGKEYLSYDKLEELFPHLTVSGYTGGHSDHNTTTGGKDDHTDHKETPVLAKRHGDHWHLYADLEGKKELGVVSEDPRKHYPNIKVEEYGSGAEHSGQVAGPDFELSDNLKKKREDLAKQMGVPADAIRVIVEEGKVIGFEYPHEDHFHFVRVTDDAEQSELTDAQKRELTAYLRKSYGLLLGTPVTFHKDFVVFAIPHPHQDYDVNRDYYSDELDPNYDAGHVHPYAVPLATLRIPEVTGVPELDFENELIEAARRRGVAPSEVKIKDQKYFVLPGKDHDHYLNILTPMEGYKAYFANKLPDIAPSFAQGTYSKDAVVAEMNRVLSVAKDKFKDDTVAFRRVARVLEAFEAKLSIPTTSTQGYVQALQAFENQYIKGITDAGVNTPVEKNEFTESYERLIEKLKTYDERTLSQYGIHPTELVTQLQKDVVAKNEKGLKEVEIHFAAIDRAKLASSDLAPRLAYMDYFVRNLDSDRLSASLRLEVINKLNELYKISGLYRNPQKFRETLKSTALLKEKVKAALASNVPAPDHENWKPYPRGFYRKDISSTINSMRDFVIKNKEITAEEMAEGFGKKLDLFPVHPKKPKN